RSAAGMFLSQSKFVEEILERAHMQNCNPCKTPVDFESKLGSDGDPTLYRSLAGELYILRYVHGTLDYGLRLHVSSTIQLTTYTDVDWAGCPATLRSTSGYCVFLGDNLLSWSAKRQVTLSCSSAKAIYRSVANVVAETIWIRNLLRELRTPLYTATLVYCDNVSAVYMSVIPVQHQPASMFLSQSKFVEEILERAHMQNCNPCKTTVDFESKLGSDGDPTLYRSLAGEL
nr:hypothetical protein [Tanacetum cinerariifolium]